jgi:hypothetical protein
MAFGMPRTPGSASSTAPAAANPIARTFALVVLAALIGLVVLRQLFGAIRVEVGVR